MMTQTFTPAWGANNADLNKATDRLIKGDTYRDLSTVVVLPTRGSIPARVYQNHLALMMPMNQKVTRWVIENDEVGEAYERGVDAILENAETKKWKYLLTIEEDNLPPPDGLLKLYESIEGGVDGKKYDAVGGLYWTKGEGGQPMIYGDPNVLPRGYVPQLPKPNEVQRCNGLGMGFTLFRLSMFKGGKLKKPWFKTEQSFDPAKGTSMFTQDLFFFHHAGDAGFKFASDNRVLVGHLDVTTGMVW